VGKLKTKIPAGSSFLPTRSQSISDPSCTVPKNMRCRHFGMHKVLNRVLGDLAEYNRNTSQNIAYSHNAKLLNPSGYYAYHMI
jgi:hypothetical protein